MSCADVDDSPARIGYNFHLSRGVLASSRALKKQDLVFFKNKLGPAELKENISNGAFMFASGGRLSLASAYPYTRVKSWKLPAAVGSKSAGIIDQLFYTFKDGRSISVFLVNLDGEVEQVNFMQYIEILERVFMSLEGAGVMAISCSDVSLQEVLKKRLKAWTLTETSTEGLFFYCSDNLRWEHEIKDREYGVDLKYQIFQKRVLSGSK